MTGRRVVVGACHGGGRMLKGGPLHPAGRGTTKHTKYTKRLVLVRRASGLRDQGFGSTRTLPPPTRTPPPPTRTLPPPTRTLPPSARTLPRSRITRERVCLAQGPSCTTDESFSRDQSTIPISFPAFSAEAKPVLTRRAEVWHLFRCVRAWCLPHGQSIRIRWNGWATFMPGSRL